MLSMSEVAPHEWEFVYPEIYYRVMDKFHSGCDAFEEGNLPLAERIFKSVLRQMPDHLDAIHHLAMVQSELGEVERANDLWEQSVRIGRKGFPAEFDREKDRLEWGWLENRPFLRCLHGLALVRFDNGQTEEALQLFQELLRLNPNDNQGVRAMAAEALFELEKYEEVLNLTRKYPGDMMPEILYGRAFAQFKLGRQQRANVALKRAIGTLPLVAKELLKKKHRRPKTARPGVVTLGGPDEAYYYWEQWGALWQADPDALKWLKARTEGVPF